MPKRRTNPFLLDQELSIRISDLKSRRCLVPLFVNRGTIVWCSKLTGWELGRVSVCVDMRQREPTAEFSFIAYGGIVTQSVRLVCARTNLGGGRCFYFLCPETGRRCRVLHRYRDRFVHRSAIPGAMYSDQADSKLWRGDHVRFRLEHLKRSFAKKHTRTHYNGKPTRRYRQLEKYLDRTPRATESGFKVIRERMQEKLDALDRFGIG
jgi:hypothetical protein